MLGRNQIKVMYTQYTQEAKMEKTSTATMSILFVL
jgi:hypothetical protein